MLRRFGSTRGLAQVLAAVAAPCDWEHRSMAFKARIYLQRPAQTHAEYLGEIELDMRPIREGRTRFTHDGQIVVGHIDSVTPPDWDRTGFLVTQQPRDRGNR